jgi:cytochrome c554/c'-like protein
MRRGRYLPLIAGTMLFAAAVTASLLARGAAAASRSSSPPTLQSASDSGQYVGPGSCSAVACHGAIRPAVSAGILQTEYSTWIAMDRHARAAEVLGNVLSQRMARLLGIGNPQQAQKCLVCHSLDVPAAARGSSFLTEGVSCEACHGPASGWLGYHVTREATHEESVKRGMYDTKDVVKRTEKCLACHLGTSEKVVDHEMIAAGHPDLVFELEAFSAAMPRHWKDPLGTDAARPVRTFAVGQLVHFRASLDRLGRRVKGPAWPEYAELDCFACHHSLTRPEESWRQAQGYERRARPGLAPLQVSRYVTARRVLAAWDAQGATELDSLMDRLQIEASRLAAKPDAVVPLTEQARTIVDRAITRVLSSAATPEMAGTILRGIFADAPQIAERGERAAEQAAMAAEVLATAMAKAHKQDPAALKPVFTELFKQFESPSAYEPSRFIAAMKKAEGAVR